MAIAAMFAALTLVWSRSVDAVVVHSPTPAVTARSAPFRQDLTNGGDAYYTIELNVGGQSVHAIPDSGSFDILVFSAQCAICNAPDAFDGESSSTFVGSEFLAEQSFGSGTAESVEAYDDVSVGPLAAKHQVFWEVINADDGFEDMTFGAILGVGPPHSALTMANLEADMMVTEVQKMKDQGRDVKRYEPLMQQYQEVAKHVAKQTLFMEHNQVGSFSVCLSAARGANGVWVWNDDVYETHASLFAKVPVVGDTYWSVELRDVRLAFGHNHGESTDLGCGSAACSGIVDTGTSLLVVPTTTYQAVFDALASSNINTANGCSDLEGLPDMVFKMGGHSFNMPPEIYMGELEGDVPSEMMMFMPRHHNKANTTQQTGVHQCQPLIMSNDEDSEDGPVWILGLPLFRRYYTTFHLAEGSRAAADLHFAEADEECNPTKSEQLMRQSSRGSGRRTLTPLRVNAAKLRLPHWLAARTTARRQNLIRKKFAPSA